MGCKMPWWAGSETPPPDKDKMIADLRAEVASLKEQNSAVTLASAHLINQLAAANGRVEKYREALEIAYDHLLVHWTEEQLKTVVPLHKIPAALSDLPEADKEKTK